MNNKKLIFNRDDLKNTVNQFLNMRLIKNDKKRFGVYYLSTTDPYVSLAKHIEAVVFNEAFGNEEEALYDEFLSYDDVSSYVLVIDHENLMPAGTARLIKNSAHGLKTLSALTHSPWSHDLNKILKLNKIEDKLNDTYDISTLAILPEYRSRSGYNLGLTIYLSLHAFAERHNVKYYVALLDDKAFNLLRKLNMPVVQLEGTIRASYMGSECTIPALINPVKLTEHFNENFHSVKKIKILSLLSEKHTAYEAEVNPDIHHRLFSYEKYVYPLVTHVPNRILRMLFKR